MAEKEELAPAQYLIKCVERCEYLDKENKELKDIIRGIEAQINGMGNLLNLYEEKLKKLEKEEQP